MLVNQFYVFGGVPEDVKVVKVFYGRHQNGCRCMARNLPDGIGSWYLYTALLEQETFSPAVRVWKRRDIYSEIVAFGI
jgi:hypothetical protein